MSARFGGRLRNKIFLMMASVGIVPILAAGFLSWYSVQVSHRNDVANLEDALLEQKADEIEGFVKDIASAMKLHVNYEKTTDLDVPTKRFLLSEFLKAKPELHDGAFLNLKGMETARFTRQYPDGVPDAALRDQSSTEKFLRTSAGEDYMGPVYFTLGEPMLTIASPVRNKDGVVISIIAGEVSLARAQKILEETRIGSTGYLYLTDREGILVAKGGAGGTASSSVQYLPLVRAVLGGRDAMGSEGQVRYQSFAGEEVVAAGKYLRDFGWGLFAEWPVKEADAIVRTIILRNLVISLAVLIAALLASVLLAMLIVRPVKRLEEGTERVAQGRFDEPVEVKTGDEIEELGTAFNKMMAGLKQLEELKDEFVFIAAHELRTPVAAMKGYLSLILDGITGPIAEKTKEFIEKVIAANQRLIQLVNDLLEVSRSEAGRLTIKVTPIDIVPPVEETLSELKPLADKENITLAYAPQALPAVIADPGRVKEVVVNLVGNAIKYMGGPGTVTISHKVRDSFLITNVADTGVGISAENQKKLFEKFYRVPNERFKEVTGTGLGLFIVKEIVEKMGGNVWAESEEGKGSIFSFSLPLSA